MQIMFVNNDGGGFADKIDVKDGITVSELFAQQMPGRKPGDFLIRCNRLPAPADQVLKDGDRVTMTPTKIEGAKRVA
ncbi:MAG: molybdopterin converting factor [Gemmataceae bacterium]